VAFGKDKTKETESSPGYSALKGNEKNRCSEFSTGCPQKQARETQLTTKKDKA